MYIQLDLDGIARKGLLQEQPNQVSRSVFNGKVYRSFDDSATKDDPDTIVVKLRAKDYRRKNQMKHQFFSTYKPETLLTEIANLLSQNGSVPSISDKSWELSFTMTKVLCEQEEAEEAVMEECEIKVYIEKFPGLEKHCVSLHRKSGSSILFYEKAKELISNLSQYNNVD